MNIQTFTYLLEHPERLTAQQTEQLATIVDKFPFFQAARAVYLKGLKNANSYHYNKQLKVTAAHTQDRSILFDFITSDAFQQNDISHQIKEQESKLRNINVHGAHDVSIQVEKEELKKANDVLDPNFFVRKEPQTSTPVMGTPIDFTKSDTHSFGEWLKLTVLKPIDRPGKSEPDTENEHLDPQREKKFQIIDEFIKNSPKIKVKPPEETIKKNLASEQELPPETLMTETLARVYTEQKNYKKAKMAYKILSLKYPKKSGFFADQIRAIDRLQVNK